MTDLSRHPLANDQTSTLLRLLEISLMLNSTVEHEALLSHIIEAVREITTSEAASILLYNPVAHSLHFAASIAPNIDVATMHKMPVPLEGSIAGQVIRDGQPLILNDAQQDTRIFRSVDQTTGFITRSLLAVPMQFKGEQVGVLESLNKINGAWTELDKRHLEILATQAAVAIHNQQQTTALQLAYQELDELDKTKNNFIAIASHELRTPLSAVLGYATFLKEISQGEANAHATQVLNSALDIRNLIEDLTNLSHLQLGTIDLIREPATLQEILIAAQHDAQSLADAKAHTLAMDLQHGELQVNADRVKLGMAFSNLLNNAIKFTPPHGHIKVHIEQHGSEAHIYITDSGVGIPADQLDRIFDKFHQVEGHMTRKHGGMGLGLAIARGMIEAHGGRIWAESDGLQKGSRFIMALPLIQPDK